MLPLDEVVLFLLRRNLIQDRFIVEGDLTIIEASRRNRNIMVICEQGASYILKEGVDSARRVTLRNEARVYDFLKSVSEGGGRALDPYIARFYGYDSQHGLLILEFLPGAEDLRKYHSQRGYFSVTLARALGKALGTVHSLTKVEKLGVVDKQSFSDSPPWVLCSLYCPTLEIYRETSNAAIELLKIVQKFPEFRQFLDNLRDGWEYSSLIHGDIKWDNCIAFSPSGSGRKTRVKIVDWELAGMGDPCWDIGSVFCDYLWFWLNSMLVAGEEPPEQFTEVAKYPLEKMHPAIAAFWGSYMKRMRLDAPAAQSWLLRAVQYGAARLIQSAYEHLQYSVRPTGTVICALQLSLNMLKRPEEALLFLLGIGLLKPPDR